MPRWWGQLTSKLRRTRTVRVHLQDGTTLSGFHRGVWAGHVVLELAKLHESVDVTVALDGLVEIPKGNILFVQTLMVVAS